MAGKDNGFIDIVETLSEFPEVQELLQRKASLSSDVRKIRRRLRTLKKKYAFLNDMLETKDTHKFEVLVAKLFREVGYKKVVHTGQHSKKEDVQVWLPDKVYRIECKNKDGNPNRTDVDQPEWRKKLHSDLAELEGYEQRFLMVVNHQNKKPPKGRSANPLADDIERKLILDGNGLVTSFELYKGFMKLKKGHITLEQFDESMNKVGLIEF